MNRLAIIPARGGSKRIPRKNVRPFLGKPIIAYSIAAALESDLFDEVMVSTDDGEIAEVARRYGAKVPFLRSPETAGDFAGTIDVLREVHGRYESTTFSEACCIYATAPFISVDLLHRTLAVLESGRDSVFPVLPYSFPIQRALKMTADGKMLMFQPRHLNSRSQDLEPAYHDCGMFYWYKPNKVLPAGKLWTDNSGCLVLSEMAAQDIDTVDDWRVAEFKYRLLHGIE
ncbi:N-acylneuraminate cytidylyltransferase [Lewinella aquimaris]|uniref:N-acylneuraminate cytidylyltransferase n=1 Tax=Neolewinella aquimaris TaxID=1835722 RepID=A0A840E563_9BACT|nr:pseudaminic acid cytidylyltransferase [Neolewinella aquimaris]MBB4080210.1 N-acylneuraminate cytidylyltransferase [Neolewinella aquimaris]